MKRFLAVSFVGLVLFITPGCFTLNHTVGGGPTGAGTVETKQWYALWGLVPLDSSFDTKNLAGGSTSYRVTTQWGITDILLNILTGPFSFYSTTVRVEK